MERGTFFGTPYNIGPIYRKLSSTLFFWDSVDPGFIIRLFLDFFLMFTCHTQKALPFQRLQRQDQLPQMPGGYEKKENDKDCMWEAAKAKSSDRN